MAEGEGSRGTQAFNFFRVGCAMIEPQIIQAAKRKESVLLRKLLLGGIDPDTRDVHGETAMTWAAFLGHTPIVKDLLAAGADQENIGSLFQSPPLILAAHRGHRGIVALLAVKSDLDAVDPQGATALMRVIDKRGILAKSSERQLKIIQILIDAGANLEIQDLNGQTALGYAVLARNSSVVQVLCERGASRMVRDNKGVTILELADSLGDVEMMRLLQSFLPE